MPDEPAANLRRLGALSLLLVTAAAAVWWGLDRFELRPHWLQVEAPRLAVAGQPLPFRVRLAPLATPTRLCADIHGGVSRDTTIGYVATGGSQAVGTEGGTFDFEINVPSRPGLRFVTGIFFLSPTGEWRDHTLVAATVVVPVSDNAGDKVDTRLAPLRTEASDPGNADYSRPAAAPRWLTGLVLLLAAVWTWRGNWSAAGSGTGLGRRNRQWRLLAMAMALACVWELFGLENWLVTQARTIARASDLYYPRAILQRAAVSLAIVASIFFCLFIRRVSSSRRLLVVAFALYVAIAAVNLVSWHPIDNIADLSWHGLTVVQALKLGCAALALLGIWKAASGQSAC